MRPVVLPSLRSPARKDLLHNAVQVPAVRDALQLVLAALLHGRIFVLLQQTS
jgi:hypothetical protein